MKVGAALDIAKAWALEQVPEISGLVGIYLAGSASRCAKDEELSPLSDVDVYFVVPVEDLQRHQQRKLARDGVIIDQAYFATPDPCSPASVLGNLGYVDHLDPSGIVYDPLGILIAVYKVVIGTYRDASWIEARCRNALEMARNGQTGLLATDAQRQDRIWAFIWMCFGIAAIPIAATLTPPTTRRCVAVSRQICATHGAQSLSLEFQRLLGVAIMGPERLSDHIARYEQAFDFAVSLPPTAGFLDFDVSSISKPLMIDGVTDLIRSGCAGDAGLWLLLGWTITINRIMSAAATTATKRFIVDFDEYLAEVDLATGDGFTRKANEGHRLIDNCMDLAAKLVRQESQRE
jgi:hypothetical protein